MPPGVKKINHDLAVMRELLRPVQEHLIPFQQENELELMSLKFDYKTQKKGLDKILTGQLYSIYYEPMVAFAYKDYIKGVRDALLCVRTKGAEFIYRIKKKDVDVYFNNNHVAILDGNNSMFGLRSKSVLGRTKTYSNDLISIIIKEREVGQMFNPLRPHSPQQRAFSLISNLNDEEEGIFLSLTLFELITRMINSR